jgi:hypothetical protein
MMIDWTPGGDFRYALAGVAYLVLVAILAIRMISRRRPGLDRDRGNR